MWSQLFFYKFSWTNKVSGSKTPSKFPPGPNCIISIILFTISLPKDCIFFNSYQLPQYFSESDPSEIKQEKDGVLVNSFMHLCAFAKEIYCSINKSLCCPLEAFSGVTPCKIPSTDVNSCTQIFLYLSLISVNENRPRMSESAASTHCSCTEPVAKEPTAPVAGSLIFFLLVAFLKIYGKSQTMTLLLMTI